MIGNVLQSTPYEVFVAGHTDDQPIRGGVFKSNLALSAARAAAVVDFFLQHGFVSPDRIATMGYGEYRPVVPNTSEADRERNRRVEIILSAKPVGAATQPAPATGVSAPQ
jgi:chemotaxis protein MotB